MFHWVTEVYNHCYIQICIYIYISYFITECLLHSVILTNCLKRFGLGGFLLYPNSSSVGILQFNHTKYKADFYSERESHLDIDSYDDP